MFSVLAEAPSGAASTEVVARSSSSLRLDETTIEQSNPELRLIGPRGHAARAHATAGHAAHPLTMVTAKKDKSRPKRERKKPADWSDDDEPWSDESEEEVVESVHARRKKEKSRVAFMKLVRFLLSFLPLAMVLSQQPFMMKPRVPGHRPCPPMRESVRWTAAQPPPASTQSKAPSPQASTGSNWYRFSSLSAAPSSSPPPRPP